MTIEYKDSKRIVGLSFTAGAEIGETSGTDATTFPIGKTGSIYRVGIKIATGSALIGETLSATKGIQFELKRTGLTGSDIVAFEIWSADGTRVLRDTYDADTKLPTTSFAYIEFKPSQTVTLAVGYRILFVADGGTTNYVDMRTNASGTYDTTKTHLTYSSNDDGSGTPAWTDETGKDPNFKFTLADVGDVKPTNVQDNSLFVEKDTARRYWKSSSEDLKAYYKFEDNGTNSATTEQGLGSSADMTVTGATYVTGKVGSKAISFDGTNDYAVIGSSTSDFNFLANSSHEWTVAFWFKNASWGSNEMILSTGNELSSSRFGLGIRAQSGGNMYVHFCNGTNTNRFTTTQSGFSTDGNWHFIVITAKKSDSTNSLEFWQDGVSLGTASNSGKDFVDTDASQAPYIGQAGDSSQWLSALIDDMSIWNRRLSDSEIATLYNSGTGLAVDSANLRKATWLLGKSHVSKTGCLIYYNFDQTSGNATNLATTANGFTDGLGSTGDGVNSGATTGQTGKIDYAWSFDGTNDQVDSGSSSDLILTGDMTWAAWVNINTTTSSKVITVASIRGDAGSNTEANNTLFSFFIVQNSSPPTLRAFHENAGGTNNQVDFTTSLSEDRWYHIVFTRDVSEKTVKCYIDGSLHGSGTYSNDPTTTTSTLPLRTGGNNFSGAAASDGHFNGLLDEVSIWNRILTADEISALYNSGYGVVI